MEIKSLVGARFGTLSLNRSTSTNPFDKMNFRGKAFTGSALPFADVFQAIKPAKPNRLKMVSASVLGAVVDFKMRLSQPIALFVNMVKENIAHGREAVQRARLAMSNTKTSLFEYNKNLLNRLSNTFNHSKIREPNLGDGPKILTLKHINKNASVKDLRATWLHENEKMLQERKAIA